MAAGRRIAVAGLAAVAAVDLIRWNQHDAQALAAAVEPHWAEPNRTPGQAIGACSLALFEFNDRPAALLALDLGVDDCFIVAAAAIALSPVRLVQLLPVVPMSLGLARVSFATRRRGLVKLARLVGARTESVTLSIEAPCGTVAH